MAGTMNLIFCGFLFYDMVKRKKQSLKKIKKKISFEIND